MKILLLSFPGKDLRNPPLGIAYIASVLNENNHEAIICEGNNKTIKELIMAAGKVKPDIVGISMLTASRMDCLKIAKGIKEKFHLPIIVGGSHASLMPDQLLKNYYFLDYVVRGEGEYTCLKLLDVLEKGGKLNKIKGLSYRKKGKIIHNAPAEFIQNLDNLPFPEYKFFDLKSYSTGASKELSKQRMGHIISSRGCPHNCSFCSTSSVWGRKIRFRSPKSVVDEMEQLYKKI